MATDHWINYLKCVVDIPFHDFARAALLPWFTLIGCAYWLLYGSGSAKNSLRIVAMLLTEIEKAQRLVRTDAYQMSIGEIVTMYENKEIAIDPEFQRLFRWEIGQKSKSLTRKGVNDSNILRSAA